VRVAAGRVCGGGGGGDAQVRAAVVDDKSEGVVGPARVPERAQAADEEAHHLYLRQGVVHEGRPGGSDGRGGAGSGGRHPL